MPREDEKENPTEAPKRGARSKSTSPRTAATPRARSASAGGEPHAGMATGDQPTQRSARGTTTSSTAPSATKGTGRNGARAERSTKGKGPSHDEIAQRAYEIWQETGNPDPQENWNRAKQELEAGRPSRAMGR